MGFLHLYYSFFRKPGLVSRSQCIYVYKSLRVCLLFSLQPSVDDNATPLSQNSVGSSQFGFGLDALLAASRTKQVPSSRSSDGSLLQLSAKPLASPTGQQIGSKPAKGDPLEFPLSASSSSKSPAPGSFLRSACTHTRSSPVSTAGDSSIIAAPLSSQSSSISSRYAAELNSQETVTPGRSFSQETLTPGKSREVSTHGHEGRGPGGYYAASQDSDNSAPASSAQCSSGSSPLVPPIEAALLTRGDSLEFLVRAQSVCYLFSMRCQSQHISNPVVGGDCGKKMSFYGKVSRKCVLL